VLRELAGPDPDDIGQIGDEDLAVANFAGAGRADDCLDDIRANSLGDDNIQAHLRNEVNRLLGAMIHFLLAALTAETLHFGVRPIDRPN
jgi:hypothetical protein